MALCSDAAMVLFYDIEGDTADHDDWHSYEHFHERLSVPGFVRATRWVATAATPRYMVTYEVGGVDVATSQDYLDRLNNPTPWTSEMMPRFRGMTRGFCRIAASAGFGLGNAALALRFVPAQGAAEQLSGWIARDVLPALAARRGMVGAHLLQPAPPPPMTREQSLRGPDRAMPWLVIATAYDAAALERAAAAHLDPTALRDSGASGEITLGRYALHYTASADEVARTAPPPVLAPESRRSDGPRR
ncbi:hypothetical protein [Actibacterium sp. MT2.3-13A]|uniref:hypothetical protein n=1 Tax=Actibacterium sp. MT2.3-13A TaxID=2828332 RepID=UPI001BACEBF1|nr:hypothetical protein [Actibacterium sp. MT2.3-13A]